MAVHDSSDDPIVAQREIVDIPLIYKVVLFTILGAAIFLVVAM